MADLTTTLARFLSQLVSWPSSFSGDVIVLNRSITPGNNVTTGETTIYTFSIPANTLAANGQSIRIVVHGTGATNGNTKTIRIKFGATTVLSRATTASNFSWRAEALIYRLTATTQAASGIILESGNGGAPNTTAPAETLTSAVNLLVTLQSGTASDDLTATCAKVYWEA